MAKTCSMHNKLTSRAGHAVSSLSVGVATTSTQDGEAELVCGHPSSH